MNEAQKIVTEFLEGFNLEVTSGNVMYLFDNGYDLDFTTEAEFVSWRERDTNPLYKVYRDEVQDKYDTVNNSLTRVELEGGGEGEGEYCYGVIKIGDTYLKAEWSYYSYNGCEYDSIFDTLKVVTPKQKTITVYE